MESVINSGICRCCCSEGTYKDIKTLYYWMGKEEVYAEMLRDCFDIHLAFVETDVNSGICEVCITQLRNASNFKKQVLQTEEHFKKFLEASEKFFKAKVIKEEEEVSKYEGDVDDEGGALAHDSDNTSDDYPLAALEIKQEYKVEAGSKKRPSKAGTSKAKKRKKVNSDASSKRTGGAKDKTKKKRQNQSATPERQEHRVNLTNILQYSNATPFKDKTARGFSCLYCSKYFQNINDLRAHAAQKSEKNKIHKMIDYKLSYNPIKLDITNLQCDFCTAPLKDLNDLKEHLVDSHRLVIHKNIKDIILPFRLGDGQDYNCVVCGLYHISFKNLYHHMSTHYSNYCCSKCGVGYITIAALRKHGKTHYQGSFPCDYCDKSFSSLSKKNYHEKGVHHKGGWLRNKCPHCPQIFVSYYDRSEHLAKEHNVAPLIFPCNACDKVYKKKFELNRHIKHHHLQQKSFLCDMCNDTFFSKRGLEDHLTKHMGGEICTCDVCGKHFTRRRTLLIHLKGHSGTSRFPCELCKKVFAHKSSLKTHSKLHQHDLEIFKEFDDVKHLIDQREMTLKQIAEENKQREVDEKLKLYLDQQEQRQQHHQEHPQEQKQEYTSL